MGQPPQNNPLTISGPTNLTISSGESGVDAQYTATKNNVTWSVTVVDEGSLIEGEYTVFIDQQGQLVVEIAEGVMIPPGGTTLSLEVQAQIGNGGGSGNLATLAVDVVIAEGTIPCFVAGTKILTERGQVAVEDLLLGDLVLNPDGWPNPIVWIGSRKLSEAQLRMAPHLCPIKICRDAFGPGQPSRDLFVSPHHRIVLEGWRAEVLFGVREVFAHAVHLIDNDRVMKVRPKGGVHYYHFALERHEVVVSEGLKTESMLPAEIAMRSVSPEARAELLDLFPEMTPRLGIDPTQAALRVLKRSEARLYAVR